MTTIITKYGNGVPTSSDLETGELGIDLTGKVIYVRHFMRVVKRRVIRVEVGLIKDVTPIHSSARATVSQLDNRTTAVLGVDNLAGQVDTSFAGL